MDYISFFTLNIKKLTVGVSLPTAYLHPNSLPYLDHLFSVMPLSVCFVLLYRFCFCCFFAYILVDIMVGN